MCPAFTAELTLYAIRVRPPICDSIQSDIDLQASIFWSQHRVKVVAVQDPVEEENSSAPTKRIAFLGILQFTMKLRYEDRRNLFSLKIALGSATPD